MSAQQEISETSAPFVPKEDLVEVLCSIGLSRNAAIRALYHTGNQNADLAAAWVFENQDKLLDNPFDEGSEGTFAGDESSSLVSYKMVLVINSELGMKIGKIASQVGHGAVGLFRQMLENQQQFGEMVLLWTQFGETKIVLRGQNAKHLMELSSQAESMGLPTFTVHDAGRTEITPGSMTVLAIMGQSDLVNKVTGGLPLL